MFDLWKRKRSVEEIEGVVQYVGHTGKALHAFESSERIVVNVAVSSGFELGVGSGDGAAPVAVLRRAQRRVVPDATFFHCMPHELALQGERE